jgi:8-oxo-dGTP pyrophosphatase MutT (NUDIX family)
MQTISSMIHARLAARCVPLSGPAIPFYVQDMPIGRVTKSVCDVLVRWPRYFTSERSRVDLAPGLSDAKSRTAALAEVANVLHAEGHVTGWCNEQVSIFDPDDQQVLFFLERTALPCFGLPLRSVHLTGTTAANGGSMWLARRSMTKAVDPGLLDTLVGGAISARMSAFETLLKESWEEAGLAEDMVRSAAANGRVEVKRSVTVGWHHEVIEMYALDLPEDAVPKNMDGEVSEFLLIPLGQLPAMLAHSDDFTVEASYIIASHLMRDGFIDAHEKGASELRAFITGEMT